MEHDSTYGHLQLVLKYNHDGSIPTCPCGDNEGETPPAAGPPDFVGNDYFCDASSSRPLWDGEGCDAALSTFLHGSTSCFYSPQLMILR